MGRKAANPTQGKPAGHTHRFEKQSQTYHTACELCACGEERRRPTTAREKREHLAVWREARAVHKTWHAFADRFTRKKDGKFRQKGHALIRQVEAYSQRRKDITILPCDDGHYAGSVLVLIRHRSAKTYHGLSVVFIPQCTGEEPIRFFLYPYHVAGLAEALLGELGVARAYGEAAAEMRSGGRAAKGATARKNLKNKPERTGK